MKIHNSTKLLNTILTLMLFCMGMLFSCNTFAVRPPPGPRPYAVHKIGDAYGGGIVYYVYDGGQHGLIAATEDQNEGNPIRWSVGTFTNTRAQANLDVPGVGEVKPIQSL
jgi:hypothetical protein